MTLQPTSIATPPGYGSDGSFTDSNTGMRVLVTDVKWTPTDDPTLASGYGLIVFYVRMGNTGEAAHDFNEFNFTCIDEGDQQHDPAVLPSPYSDAALGSGALAPGDRRAGWVGCEIPQGSKLRIMWDDAYFLQPPAHVWPSLFAASTPTVKSGTRPSPVRLVGVSPESAYSAPGSSITLDYSIDNETGTSQDVRLGATAYSDQISQNSFSDEANDVIVSTSPGVHLYTRPFFFPEVAASQTFDLLVSVDDPSFTIVYGLHRYKHAITISSR